MNNCYTYLVLIRHGQSVWNKENRFTGWVDVELAEKGVEEAKAAGKLLKEKEIVFDEAYTSALKRAQNTLKLALEESEQSSIPVTKDKALNERMYGDLQGKNKDETRAEFGDEQVKIWRRSYDVAPPGGESLKDTLERVLPYYEQEIEPKLRGGKRIIIAAHGNSLRALIKHLENKSKEDILKTEVPTGKPIFYCFDEELNLKCSYFLEEHENCC